MEGKRESCKAKARSRVKRGSGAWRVRRRERDEVMEGQSEISGEKIRVDKYVRQDGSMMNSRKKIRTE